MIQSIADIHRQIVVYSAFGNTLQPFEANVFNREFIGGRNDSWGNR
jgi:hypothetical protein